MVADVRLQPGFNLENFIEIVLEYKLDRSILFVGHNPDMSLLTRHLCGANVEMKKGGMALLDVWRLEPGGAILKWFVTPAIIGARSEK